MVKIRYSLIIPAYNEEGNIFPLIEEILKIKEKPSEVIFVENGSTDNTYKKILEAKRKFYKKVNIVPARSGKGFGLAIKKGFNLVKFDHIVTIDCDLSHHPSQIPKLLRELEKNDIIIGSRFIKGGAIETKLSRKIFSFIYSITANIFLGANIRDFSSGYRAYRKKVLNSFSIISDGFEINPEILFKSIREGYRIKEVPILYLPRFWGISKFSHTKEFLKYLKVILQNIFFLKIIQLIKF